MTEKVSPARVVERKVDKAKDAVGSVKSWVMGSDDDPDDGGAVGDAKGKASSAPSSVGDTAGSAPTAANRRTGATRWLPG